MKYLRLALSLSLFMVALAPLWAVAPLKLTDGRVFENWTIIGETAGYVTIKYDQGADKVSKTLLPEPLRGYYPLDPVAVAAEEAESVKLRALFNEQIAATDAKRAHENAEFQYQVEKAVAVNEAARKQALVQAVAESKAPTPAVATEVTRSDTHVNTPRSVTSEVSTITIPPEDRRKVYVVEYEVVGRCPSVDVRFGQNGQHDEIRQVSPYFGWSRKVQAKTGDRLYLWAESGGAGGEEFRVRIKADGQVVREATGRGVHVAAEVSYDLP